MVFVIKHKQFNAYYSTNVRVRKRRYGSYSRMRENQNGWTKSLDSATKFISMRGLSEAISSILDKEPDLSNNLEIHAYKLTPVTSLTEIESSAPKFPVNLVKYLSMVTVKEN